jgi:hypothetical protein
MNKPFDAVEMQHAGAAAVQSELRGLSAAEQLAYWAQADDELEKLQSRLSHDHVRQLREQRPDWDSPTVPAGQP